MRTGGLRPSGRTRALPVPETKSVCTCQVLRPRWAIWTLALSCPYVLPSAKRTASAPEKWDFRGSMAGLRIPLPTLPCTLTGTCARLRADADRYSFIVVDFHPLLLAGFTGALSCSFNSGHSGDRLRYGSSMPEADVAHGSPSSSGTDFTAQARLSSMSAWLGRSMGDAGIPGGEDRRRRHGGHSCLGAWSDREAVQGWRLATVRPARGPNHPRRIRRGRPGAGGVRRSDPGGALRHRASALRRTDPAAAFSEWRHDVRASRRDPGELSTYPFTRRRPRRT